MKAAGKIMAGILLAYFAGFVVTWCIVFGIGVLGTGFYSADGWPENFRQTCFIWAANAAMWATIWPFTWLMYLAMKGGGK